MTNWNPFLRYPRMSLVILLAAMIPLLTRLPELAFRSDPLTLLESNPNQKEALEKAISLMPENELILIDLALPEIFTFEGLAVISRISDALLTVTGAQDVKSLTHAYKPVRRGFSLSMVPLIELDSSSKTDLKVFRDYCLSHPLVRNVMVSSDGRHTTLSLSLRDRYRDRDSQRKLRAEIQAVLEPFEREGCAFTVAGFSLVEEEVRTRVGEDLKLFALTAGPFLLIVLGCFFRSIGFVLILLSNLVVALAAILGLLLWAEYSFSVYNLPLIPLCAGIHLTLLVHLATAAGQTNPDRTPFQTVAAAIRRIGKSCAFATLTTVAGLLSLSASTIPQVRETGLLGACGIGMVFLFTFGPGVASTVLWTAAKPARKLPKHDTELAWLRWLTTLRRCRRTVLTLTALAVLFAAAGISLLRSDVRPLEFLPYDSPARAAGKLFNDRYGGFNVFQLRFDTGQTNGINRTDFLNYLDEVSRYAAARDEVSNVYSYPLLLAVLNQIWEQERPGSLKVPGNPLVLGTLTFLLKTQASQFPFLAALCDPDHRTTTLIVRTPDLPSPQYLRLIADLVDQAETGLPAGVTIHEEKGLHSILRADQELLSGQLNSAGGALATIFGLLFCLWRSWRLAALAILLNTLPIGLVLACGAFAGISLNSITITVAAIAFGIAVDDTVHLVTQWREARLSGLNAQESVERALAIKARPIVYTSLILGGIFLLLFLTSFPPVKHFGLLVALGFGLALAIVLSLLPLFLSGRPTPNDSAARGDSKAPPNSPASGDSLGSAAVD